MEIENIVDINGVKCLVLDMFDNNPFLLCLDMMEEDFVFDNKSNNYNGSMLAKTVNKWIYNKKIPTIPKNVDLTTMNGNNGYGCWLMDAAPLTFDEYRKYASIIKPHIACPFWLSTGWYKDFDSDDIYGVCSVGISGNVSKNYCYDSYIALAPAFILNMDKYKEDSSNGLGKYTTSELFAELERRIGKGK